MGITFYYYAYKIMEMRKRHYSNRTIENVLFEALDDKELTQVGYNKLYALCRKLGVF